MNKLAPRERETLAFFISEHSGKEASARLGLSGKTYSTYKKSAMRKLKVTNDVALVKLCIANGWDANTLAPSIARWTSTTPQQ